MTDEKKQAQHPAEPELLEYCSTLVVRSWADAEILLKAFGRAEIWSIISDIRLNPDEIHILFKLYRAEEDPDIVLSCHCLRDAFTLYRILRSNDYIRVVLDSEDLPGDTFYLVTADGRLDSKDDE